MEEIIQYFNEVSAEIFAELIGEFFKSPTEIAPFVKGVTEELHKVGVLIIKETFEMMDRMLCDSGKRRLDWTVERHEKKKLITSLGAVDFTKTLFENKQTGEMCFLLDRIMGLAENERITEDAVEAILNEAVDTSYRRGGDAASILDSVSKQTVKNKIHSLEFPQAWKAPEEKKTVDYLYVEADEDHVALQFINKKGDIERDSRGRKKNRVITKLIYVHEGVEPEAPKSRRHRLINPYYFSAGTDSTDNKELWNEVYRYMDAQYDLSKVKKIYVNSDGGGWILYGIKELQGLIHVMDGYHLTKSISKLTNHMKDSAEDAKDRIVEIIRHGTKKEFAELFEDLKTYFKEEPTRAFMESGEYILSNWRASVYRLRRPEGVIGSSTEGHVYHVLSGRMSTDPMGWSIRGADRMARLRAYRMNGGDMLELVRYQKQKLPKAAGAEEKYFSAADVLDIRKKRTDIVGKYYNAINHSISLQNKKKFYFQTHIWGL